MVDEPQNANTIIFQAYNAFENPDFVKTIWLTMSNKCPHSFFSSWGWISTWIKSLPSKSDIRFIVGYAGKEPVIAFFFGCKKRKKYGFLPSKILSLNSTADPYFDQLYIEYNSMLVDPSISLNTDILFRFLNSLSWDEFSFPGVSAGFVSGINLPEKNAGRDFYLSVDETTNCFFVELQKIREAGMDFYKLLSANKRSQIRRSIKQYEIDGGIQICEAASAEEALSSLDSLAILHQREWQKKGKPGAFSNKYLYQFHKSLIRDRFDNHEIQLLHIFNEKMTIGYLYNFVYRNNVYFYQCGFNYLEENMYRPGLVSHYFAIMHNAMKNMDTYDFLAGDSPYKSSLSTNSMPMYWVRLIKGRNRFWLEEKVTQLKLKLRSTPMLENNLKKVRNWFELQKG